MSERAANEPGPEPPFGEHRLVGELLERCTFPAPGTEVHCAVSGGADSSALLVLASAAGCVVTAHHVDHGLRPGSDTEAHVVEALAQRCGAGFVAHRAQISAGGNLEARARDERRRLLPAGVLTGHTLDDRAETMLINLLRGAGRSGLAPLRDPARHPIVSLRRRDTEALCAALDLDVVHDPTNTDPAFLRNRVRHEVLPLLDEVAERDLAPILVRQSDVIGAESDFLDDLAAEIDPTDAKAIAAAPSVLARRALRRFIAAEWTLDHPPAAATVDRALAVATGSAASCDLEGGHRIHRTHQKLRLLPPMGNVAVP